MKKRFLTFVMSYLLLAAFIGSAEAKTIHTTYDSSTGAGLIQLAAGSGSRIVGEPNDGMEWLLALYGIEAESDLIPLEDTSTNSADEVLPTNEEYEEDFSLGEDIQFGHNLAGLVYDDRLLDQIAAASIATDQTTVFDPTSEKDPVMSYETIPMVYLNPPTVVYSGKPTRPSIKELDPVKAPVSSSEKPPEAVNPPPEAVNPPPEAVNPPPEAVNPPPEAVNPPPEAVNPPLAAVNPPLADVIPPPQVVIPVENPNIVVPSPGPEKPGYNPPGPGPNKIEFPDNSTINPPAPVPEPATMLLFSTGIAGLAFSTLRRNKNADEKKKG